MPREQTNHSTGPGTITVRRNANVNVALHTINTFLIRSILVKTLRLRNYGPTSKVRGGLYQELSYYGIHGPILTWLQALLPNRSQRANISSHGACILSGVPQGTVLAPLLFLMYINDLPLCIHNKLRLYADDVLLHSH